MGIASVGRQLRQGLDRLDVRLVLVLAVLLLPLMIVSILRSQSVIKQAEARAQAALIGETLKAVRDEVSFIDRASSVAATLASISQEVSADPRACSELMRQIIVGSAFSFAGYYDLSGNVKCSSAPAPFSFGMTPDLEAQIADPVPTVSINEEAPASRTSVIYASHPVRDQAGELLGFSAVSVPHFRLESNDDDELGATFLTIKPDGTVLTGPGSPSNDTATLPHLTSGQSFATLPPSFTGTGRDGIVRVYAVTPIISGKMYAIGLWTTDEGVAEEFYFTYPALFPFLMWLASLAVAAYAARYFVSQHVLQLRQAMRIFSSDRKSPELAAFRKAPSELRDVAGEFVEMTNRILHEEARLEDVARQKDVLLREVHHRVKNNLQLIASIMNMQMHQSRSPEVKRLIRSLHDRVNSLATVHRDLYQTSGQAYVRMDELLNSIVTQVLRMGTKQWDVDLVTRMDELRLNPDQAVPLSLFVTEALTNALKYIGAANDTKPNLRVSLSLDSDRVARFEIENSMPNFVKTPNGEQPSGLGSELMEAFSEQLEGKLDRGIENGRFVVRLLFPIETLVPKADTKA